MIMIIWVENGNILLTELQISKEKYLLEINEFNFRKIKIKILCQLGLTEKNKERSRKI